MVSRPVGHMTGGREFGRDGDGFGHGRSSYGMLAWLGAMSAVAGAWLGESPGVIRLLIVTIVLITLVWLSRARTRSVVTCAVVTLVIVSLASSRSRMEWQRIEEAPMGHFAGAATLVSDPDPVGRAVRTVVEIEGWRYEVWAYGRMAGVMKSLETGRMVVVDGSRKPATGSQQRRLALRHVMGRFDVTSIDVETLGNGERGIDLMSNRLRGTMRVGASFLEAPNDELFTGLVYGDDRGQPDDMIARFRESGLAHLTAVSGQNVVYVLSVCGPLLRRLRRWWRLTATLSVLAWFVVLTRAEPSVLRAATMASIAAIGFAVGGRHRTGDVLAVTVAVLVLVDPFLVWSVGWWMSIGGTMGLVFIAPVLANEFERRRRRPPGVVVETLIATVSAQVGVLPVSAMVFGWPNALSTIANMAAVPVAGAVMLVGIPASLAAAVLPRILAECVMWPIGVMVAWIDDVARLGERLHPPVTFDIVASSILVTTVGVVLWRSHGASRSGGVSPTRVPTLGDGRLPVPRSR